MTVSAHDAARAIRDRLGNSVGVVKLHKLLYYAQGWHLVVTGDPMFSERIEAWANGPVVAELWADEKHNRPHGEPLPLPVEYQDTIDYVCERYGSLTGQTLIRMTHREDPWRVVSEVDDPAAPSNPEINAEALIRFFSKDPEYTIRYQRQVSRHYEVMRSALGDDDPSLEAAIDRFLAQRPRQHERQG